MEAYTKVMIVVLAIMLIVGSGPMLGNAQQYSFCHMTKDGLNACLPYASKDSSVDPDTACCTAIGNADLKCLCKYKGLVSLYARDVDVKKAMELPVKCKVVQSFNC